MKNIIILILKHLLISISIRSQLLLIVDNNLHTNPITNTKHSKLIIAMLHTDAFIRPNKGVC